MAATNLQALKPVELMRMINTTQFGEVLSEPRLRRHRNRAGYTIGDDRTINLLSYTGWLVWQRYYGEKKQPVDYEEKKRRMAERSADLVRAAQDIGELPEVVDPDRKAKAIESFKTFCESYFGEIFYLPWSQDHLRVIDKIERAVRNGGLFALAMARGSGKALALDTPIPTPSGWTTMGEIIVGDTVFNEKGYPARVIFTTDVMYNHNCYKVVFSDGEEIICDAEHLWTVYDKSRRKNPVTISTQDMIHRFIRNNNRGWAERRYTIPLAEMLKTDHADLPIAPYSLGIWLGDGCCRTSLVTLNGDDADEICQYVRQEGETGNPIKRTYDKGNVKNVILTPNRIKEKSFQGRLRKLGLLQNKHIPASYLRASTHQRFSLLQGIMDTDGYVDIKGHCEIVIKSSIFAATFEELLSSLGIKYGISLKIVSLKNKIFGPYYRFHFVVHNDYPIFQLKRKFVRLKDRPKSYSLCKTRQIVDVVPVPTVPVRCIQVDSPNHLYLCGKKMVPTHNTVLCEVAVVWAALIGAAPFVCLIASSADRSRDLLENIKTWLETNESLYEDFPEVCFPIRALERIVHRQKGQKYQGIPTRIEWAADRIILPTIEGSLSSGVIISSSGMKGSDIRGQNIARADGKVIRPSLILVDDPQTTESAWSPSQSERREAILAGDVLGMAGPGQKIAGLMACTVIRPDDMADRILNRDTHPEWQGERTKMVNSFPINEGLWAKYAELRADSLRNDGDGSIATEFYQLHKDEMDLGASVSWPERYNSDEISAIQHAMNLRLRDESAFFAEYQNEPLVTEEGEEMLTAETIASKTNGYDQNVVPLDCQYLSAFIDVHEKVLYYLLAAWESNFSGYIIDYGTYPDQQRQYFTLREAQRTLALSSPGSGLEGILYAGLDSLCNDLFSRVIYREDGMRVHIDRCLIDANWGQSTDVVYQFCRQSKHSNTLLPSHGKYVGASSQAFSEYRKVRGDRIGAHWRIPNILGKRQVKHAVIDTNYWKSFVHARLAVSMGDPGCLSLFGHDSKRHQLLSEHLVAEYRVKTLANGRTVDEWKTRANNPDNHWLDCLVGCAVGASICGAELTTLKTGNKPERQRVSFAELQKQRHSDSQL
ncbi:MAG: phage terminase large subunit family protein [Thermoguttaceae bacterium]|nr:phage terminase large subunit family protein [Thermoguttaceae bacterium]